MLSLTFLYSTIAVYAFKV